MKILKSKGYIHHLISHSFRSFTFSFQFFWIFFRTICYVCNKCVQCDVCLRQNNWKKWVQNLLILTVHQPYFSAIVECMQNTYVVILIYNKKLLIYKRKKVLRKILIYKRIKKERITSIYYYDRWTLRSLRLCRSFENYFRQSLVPNSSSFFSFTIKFQSFMFSFDKTSGMD